VHVETPVELDQGLLVAPGVLADVEGGNVESEHGHIAHEALQHPVGDQAALVVAEARGHHVQLGCELRGK
jgi:hypothetical protein